MRCGLSVAKLTQVPCWMHWCICIDAHRWFELQLQLAVACFETCFSQQCNRGFILQRGEASKSVVIGMNMCSVQFCGALPLVHS